MTNGRVFDVPRAQPAGMYRGPPPREDVTAGLPPLDSSSPDSDALGQTYCDEVQRRLSEVFRKIHEHDERYRTDRDKKKELEQQLEQLRKTVRTLALESLALWGQFGPLTLERNGLDVAKAPKEVERTGLQEALTRKTNAFPAAEAECTAKLDALDVPATDMTAATAAQDDAFAKHEAADKASEAQPAKVPLAQEMVRTWKEYLARQEVVRGLQPAYDRARAPADAACKQRDDLRADIGTTSAALDRIQGEIAPLQKRIDDIDRETGDIRREAGGLDQQIYEINQQIADLQADLDKLNQRATSKEREALDRDKKSLWKRQTQQKCFGPFADYYTPEPGENIP